MTDFNSIEGQGQGYPLKWPLRGRCDFSTAAQRGASSHGRGSAGGLGNTALLGPFAVRTTGRKVVGFGRTEVMPAAIPIEVTSGQ